MRCRQLPCRLWWQNEATADERHVVVTMPVKLGEFRELLAKLLPPKEVVSV